MGRPLSLAGIYPKRPHAMRSFAAPLEAPPGYLEFPIGAPRTKVPQLSLSLYKSQTFLANLSPKIEVSVIAALIGSLSVTQPYRPHA